MKNTQGQFAIKAYSKRELAMLYFPDIEPESATRQLQLWIDRCTALSDALRASNYIHRQRILTPKQVRLIVDYLGEP